MQGTALIIDKLRGRDTVDVEGIGFSGELSDCQEDHRSNTVKIQMSMKVSQSVILISFYLGRWAIKTLENFEIY
jgi:hypothetical protein